MTAIRLVVVDPALERAPGRAGFTYGPCIDVVGEAATVQEAVDRIGGLRPDVVLVDADLPDVDALDATRRLLSTRPEVGVILLTAFDDDESVFAAMRAGAKGFVSKGASQDELRRAIEAVARGEVIYGPRVAARILRFFQSSRRDLPMTAFPDLTDREREVLDLIAVGLGNAAIARRLHIAQKTVRNHVSSIFGKLDVADRAQAIVRGREAGFGERER